MSALAVCPPSTVPMVALATVAEFDPLRPKEFETANREVAFVPMAAVSEDGAMRVPEYRDIDDLGSGYTYFQNGDILVAKITPCFENNKIALVNIDRFHGFGSTEFHVIRPAASRLDRRYLLHLLRLDRIRSDGERRMTGSAGQRRVPRSFLQELQIPLPPLEEQRRIAAILDQADTIRRQRRAALERLDELKSALFPASRGAAERCSFGSLLEIPLRNGVSPATSGSHEGLVLTLSAVTGDSFNVNSYKAGMFANAIPVEKRVDRRDLLICRGNGNKGLVGRGFFPTEDMPDVAFPDTIIAARVDRKRLVPEFIEAAWNMPETRKQIEQSARTTNGTFKINQEMLEAVEVSIPPLSLQQAFAERVRAIEALKEQHRAHLAQLDTLFASLQHRAFSGEL